MLYQHGNGAELLFPTRVIKHTHFPPLFSMSFIINPAYFRVYPIVLMRFFFLLLWLSLAETEPLNSLVICTQLTKRSQKLKHEELLCSTSVIRKWNIPIPYLLSQTFYFIICCWYISTTLLKWQAIGGINAMWDHYLQRVFLHLNTPKERGEALLQWLLSCALCHW